MLQRPGQRLRTLREARGESLRDLEKAVGLHYSYLSALEREQKEFGNLRVEHVISLSRHFGVSVEYLLGTVPLNLEGLVRRQLASLSPAARREFTEAGTAGQRMALVLQWLVDAGYPEFAPGTLAVQLGFTEAELEAVLAGRSPASQTLLNNIMAETGLPPRLFLFGDLGPTKEAIAELLEHPDADAYLDILLFAARNGISPCSLRHLAQSFVDLHW